jgi:hypothetical protein
MWHKKTIVHGLSEFSEGFEPLKQERIVASKTIASLTSGTWNIPGDVPAMAPWLSVREKMMYLLASIHAFNDVADWSGHDLTSHHHHPV